MGYATPEGVVAVGGTLGSLIPPSVLFIIYGIFTETSINNLFLAGVLPGLLSLAGFLIVIYLWVKFRPEAGPAPKEEVSPARSGERSVGEEGRSRWSPYH